MLGVLLWFMLPLILPWGAGDWLSALPIGGGPFQAGASLMQRADPATWERMMRLYRVCPPECATELCEAALAARSARPLPTVVSPAATRGQIESAGTGGRADRDQRGRMRRA